MINEYMLIQNNFYHPELKQIKSFNLINEFKSSVSIANIFKQQYELHKAVHEYVYLVSLDTNAHILGIFQISQGNTGNANLDTRDILLPMLLTGGERMFLLHNHPNGCFKASDEDINTTKQISWNIKPFKIELVDHVIICKNKILSMKEQNLF